MAASLSAVTSLLERGQARPRVAGPRAGRRGRRVGQQTLEFRSRPRIVASAAVAGPKEARGPLGGYWDRAYQDHLLGQRSWERAERRMCLDAALLALEKAGLEPADIDLHLGGDLMNQLTCANFTAVELDIPFIGLFAACATWAEELAVAAMATDAGFAGRVLCTTSSHHDTVERQYRFPTELGNQKPPTSQWTATGAAAAIVAGEAGDDDEGRAEAVGDGQGAQGHPAGGGGAPSAGPGRGNGRVTAGGAGSDGHRHAGPSGTRESLVHGDGDGDGRAPGNRQAGERGPAGRATSGARRGGHRVHITHATFGRVIDMGLTDPNDMGSAMAPAAADTIRQHLQDTGRKPADYDLIVTGDLARIGHQLLSQLLREQGYDAEGVLADCGIMLYDASQGVYAGGSGAACSALVTAGYLLRRLENGDLRRILLVCTGCLHSTTSYKQGESLPTVAHAVVLEAGA